MQRWCCCLLCAAVRVTFLWFLLPVYAGVNTVHQVDDGLVLSGKSFYVMGVNLVARTLENWIQPHRHFVRPTQYF